jgi:PAS domain S-box-containing protein
MKIQFWENAPPSSSFSNGRGSGLAWTASDPARRTALRRKAEKTSKMQTLANGPAVLNRPYSRDRLHSPEKPARVRNDISCGKGILFMHTQPNPSVLNIALVGDGEFCREMLQKKIFEFEELEMQAHIKAVAINDPDAEELKLARQLGLATVLDYHELYQPHFKINIMILLTPEPELYEDILKTRPAHIRLVSYPAFKLLHKAIGVHEEELRRKSREFKMILDGIDDFILVLTPDMEITEVNDSFLKRMGYAREEVIGKKCHEVFQKINRMCSAKVLCPLKEVIRNKRPRQRLLTRIDREGGLRHIEVTIYPVWDADGKILKFVEISRDVTERIEEEEVITQRLEKMVEKRTRQLKETQGKLIQQDKMASLGKLSASVVHEINNPIAGILNLNLLMQRILAENDLDPENIGIFKKYLNLMETETRRVSRIISNLLGFSRQSNMELKAFDLDQLIDKTLLLNENLLKIGHVEVVQEMAPNLPKIVGSPDLLQQVFINMISNAAEAMQPEGGTLHISTGLLSNGNIQLQFKDTGIGIPAGNRSRLFEPFFTTKKKGKGVGLGLSVVYGIVEEHGGRIDVESKEGDGTLFRIELPVEALPEKLDN